MKNDTFKQLAGCFNFSCSPRETWRIVCLCSPRGHGIWGPWAITSGRFFKKVYLLTPVLCGRKMCLKTWGWIYFHHQLLWKPWVIAAYWPFWGTQLVVSMLVVRPDGDARRGGWQKCLRLRGDRARDPSHGSAPSPVIGHETWCHEDHPGRAMGPGSAQWGLRFFFGLSFTNNTKR